MSGGRMQPGGIRQPFQIHRFVVAGQRIEQIHHALDDLDRCLAVAFGHDFPHFSVALCNAAILHGETRKNNPAVQDPKPPML